MRIYSNATPSFAVDAKHRQSSGHPSLKGRLDSSACPKPVKSIDWGFIGFGKWVMVTALGTGGRHAHSL
jgi:hypothetical protein